MNTLIKQSPAPIVITDARSEHIPAILDIYSVYVTGSLCTFEEVVPSLAEMHRRLDRVRRAGLPWFVALESNTVVGYAYAGSYRARSAYNGTVENSVYVGNAHHGKGIGKGLLGALVAECKAQGRTEMIAVVGDSANVGSIALHERIGFMRVGVLKNVGKKFNRSVDTVLMQLNLQ
jgi:phosphinothricin acetyltransferase